MAAVTIGSDFGAQENNLSVFPLFPHLFAMKWRDLMLDLSFLNVKFKAKFFTLLFHFHQEALWFFFAFCHKGGVICVSEVIGISPILSPCLFNLYAEYIMQNAGLDKAQVGIKIAGRNIKHFRYADNTTLMAESEQELKSLLMRVREES